MAIILKIIALNINNSYPVKLVNVAQITKKARSEAMDKNEAVKVLEEDIKRVKTAISNQYKPEYFNANRLQALTLAINTLKRIDVLALKQFIWKDCKLSASEGDEVAEKIVTYLTEGK